MTIWKRSVEKKRFPCFGFNVLKRKKSEKFGLFTQSSVYLIQYTEFSMLNSVHWIQHTYLNTNQKVPKKNFRERVEQKSGFSGKKPVYPVQKISKRLT